MWSRDQHFCHSWRQRSHPFAQSFFHDHHQRRSDAQVHKRFVQAWGRGYDDYKGSSQSGVSSKYEVANPQQPENKKKEDQLYRLHSSDGARAVREEQLHQIPEKRKNNSLPACQKTEVAPTTAAGWSSTREKRPSPQSATGDEDSEDQYHHPDQCLSVYWATVFSCSLLLVIVCLPCLLLLLFSLLHGHVLPDYFLPSVIFRMMFTSLQLSHLSSGFSWLHSFNVFFASFFFMVLQYHSFPVIAETIFSPFSYDSYSLLLAFPVSPCSSLHFLLLSFRFFFISSYFLSTFSSFSKSSGSFDSSSLASSLLAFIARRKQIESRIR